MKARVLALALLVACTAPAEERLEGRVLAYVEDHADGSSRTGYALETPSGYVELAASAAIAAHVGDRVVVDGHDVDATGVRAGSRRVAVDAIRALPVDTLAHVETGTPRTVRVAYVLLNFAGSTPQSLTPAGAASILATVRGYYQELSYGIWNIESDVFGPYTVARPADCNLDTIGELARQAARSAGVAIDQYAHVGVTLPDNGATGLDCACGLAWLGRTPAQPSPEILHTSLYTCVEANAFSHELGHGFGLHHASTADCDGQAMRRNLHGACAIDEYGNQFNTMGNGLGHMNGFQKSTMKWLGGCNHVRVSRDATFDVVAIQVASDEVQTLQIATGDQRDGKPISYYVEYRNPALATFNAGGNPPRERGAGVHVDVAPDITEVDGDRRPILLDVTAGSSGDFVDPRLTAGRSFADPDGRVTITVVETRTDRARIQVSFPGGGAGANLCIDGASPPGTDGEAAAVTLFEHCDFGGWAVGLVAGDYNAAQLAALGVPTDAASSLHVAAGYEATLFDGPDFTGDSRVLTAASACLVPDGFNDRLSSLRIRSLAPVDPPDAGGGGPDAGPGNPADDDATGGCGGCGAGGGDASAALLGLLVVFAARCRRGRPRDVVTSRRRI